MPSRATAGTDIWRTERRFHMIAKEFRQVSAYSDGLGDTVCKTVGSAYVGSNPTPATTYNASSSGMRPDHRRWLEGLRADLGRRSCEFRRRRVWPGQSPAAGSRRNSRAWALPGAVAWWLSRSHGAAVIGEAGRWSLPWPAGSLGYVAGTWTPAGAGFSTAPLRVPGCFQATSSLRRRRLGPGKHRHREST